MSSPARTLISAACLAIAGWSAACTNALASPAHGADDHAPAAAHGTADAHASESHAPAHGDAHGAAPAAAPAAGGNLDALRDKLAARLGATAVAKTNTMQVENTAAHAPPPAAERHADAAIAQARQHGEVIVAAREAAPRKSRSRRKASVETIEDDHAELHPVAGHEWGYVGSGGPDTWGALKPEFSLCSTGKRQSPIDIRGGIAVDLQPIQFDYRPTGFAVIDNGHTVQVNVGAGNSIEVMNKRYDLAQFHFHRPSEERINGRQSDMVVHLVHKDYEGHIAVVAVLLERGSAQPLLQKVWNSLPLEKNTELLSPDALDLNNLLPTDRRYYTYMGSLTTPPCSEGVLWMVMKQPVQVSTDQIAIFGHLYPMNARPVQASAGRLIKESN